jgi:LAO/AO transport system kinase
VTDPVVQRLLERVREGERPALARLISAFEDRSVTLPADGVLDVEADSVVIGITGPPGAGKSTLISALVGHARSLGLRVGVLAVDPSSPRTGGALLGDRVRMAEHAADPEVYIRGLASRGRVGGLTDVLPDATLALELWGADVVLLETVGVGQDATRVAAVADVTVLVATAAGGDEIQAAKAGVLEVVDVVVVCKADLPGAPAFAASMQSMLRLHRGNDIPVVCACARDGSGVGELWALVHRPRCAGMRRQRRRRAALDRLAAAIGDEIARFVAHDDLDVDGVVAACLDGRVAVDDVVARFVHRLRAGGRE